MKIQIPLTKKNLYIESRFHFNNTIVSLGCDCQPAYLLDSLHLRKQSLPFDWLKTEPIEGLKFAVANFRNDFKDFLTDLTINDRGHVVSRNFPYSEFFHDKELITDLSAQEKYKRKILRFLDLIKHEKVNYLYNISISDLLVKTAANYFLDSIKEFSTEIKSDDTLHIYFCRETQNLKEKEIFNYFIERTNSIRNVMICLYLRKSEIYGIWGNEKGYKGLLADLKINVRKKMLPEIYISDY